MKKNKQLKDFQITSFIEGEDDDGHYKLEGDLEIAGIMYVNLKLKNIFEISFN